MKIQTIDRYLKLSAMMALTLGLAPFIPEPHVLGKLKWIISGGNGMQVMDYFDLLLHGSPWVLLVVMVSLKWKKNAN